MQNIKDVNDYLKKVSKSYNSKNKITDILNNFRLLTPEYQKLRMLQRLFIFKHLQATIVVGD